MVLENRSDGRKMRLRLYMKSYHRERERERERERVTGVLAPMALVSLLACYFLLSDNVHHAATSLLGEYDRGISKGNALYKLPNSYHLP